MAITCVTFHFNLKSANAAATAIRAAGISIPPFAPSGHTVCQIKNSPRLTMTPTTAAVMAVKGAVKPALLWVVSINGPPASTKMKDGRKVNGHHAGGNGAADKQHIRAKNGMGIPAHKSDKRDHHNQRAGRGFSQRQPVHHLPGSQSAKIDDSTLINVWQDGVGPTEGKERSLGKEPAHLRHRMRPAQPQRQHRHGNKPEQCTRCHNP